MLVIYPLNSVFYIIIYSFIFLAHLIAISGSRGQCMQNSNNTSQHFVPILLGWIWLHLYQYTFFVSSQTESSAYITDEFGSLSGLPDVGTVGHGGVVQAGFSVLLVRNLQRDKKKTNYPNCPENYNTVLNGSNNSRCSGSWPRPWRASRQAERSSGCRWTCPFLSQTLLCTISAVGGKNIVKSRG